MYHIETKDNVTEVTRENKSGTKSLIATVINTATDRILMIKSDKLKAYRFDGVQLKHDGGVAMGIIKDTLEIYKRPHTATVHNAIIAKNRGVLYHNAYATVHSEYNIAPIENDIDLLINDMAECIAVL